jgi:hypothetical protein
MPPEVDVEADPFLKVLTDALRAGPGSPEWHQAVTQLRDGGAAAAPHRDEYNLLVTARERLEQGKDYRSVRPGAGFTRKVFDGIERENEGGEGRRPTIPTANLVALGSALAIAGVLALVLFFLFRGDGDGDVGGRGEGIKGLTDAYFPDAVASARFDGRVPAGWKTIGSLKLDAAGGLRPAQDGGPPDGQVDGQVLGGGVVRIDPLAAGGSYVVDAKLLLPASAAAGITEVFVSDSPEFSHQRAAGAGGELAWSLQEGSQRVVAGGNVQGPAAQPGAAQATGPLAVEVRFNGTVAVIKAGGRQLWAGEHKLDPAKARYVGVRFLQAAGGQSGQARAETPVVQSVDIFTRKDDGAGSGGGGGARPAEGR